MSGDCVGTVLVVGGWLVTVCDCVWNCLCGNWWWGDVCDCVGTVLVVGGCLVTVWELSWWGGCLVTVWKLSWWWGDVW